ncbi:hypothetical protein [Saccharopolyspora mangrovi]|uniref:Uncharacterized protein n=1 Tax=Saccharopolyspora mangrovi TaxID=3082379 RepID=A0ABU6AHN9_9PSEU|nr:hypothetical protein [Saccharopolyspora sp. S2-29]MEB3370963.1 hypothetical protein [Saccharopolyspora sp. S2-29]
MAEFEHVTWDDLNRLTRGELLDRLEAEREHWARQEHGGFTEADRPAREEFNRILLTACAPADATGETATWLARGRPNGHRWNQGPGHHQQ